jgi:hypothetical protein
VNLMKMVKKITFLASSIHVDYEKYSACGKSTVVAFVFVSETHVVEKKSIMPPTNRDIRCHFWTCCYCVDVTRYIGGVKKHRFIC